MLMLFRTRLPPKISHLVVSMTRFNGHDKTAETPYDYNTVVYKLKVQFHINDTGWLKLELNNSYLLSRSVMTSLTQ